MMNRIAVAYSSRYGQTKKIALYLEEKLQEYGLSTVLIDTDHEPWPQLPSMLDGVLFGTPVYAGRFRKSLLRWARANRRALASLPTGLFTVSLNAADRRPAARDTDAALIRALVDQVGIVPTYSASLAGSLDYRKYSWLVRRLMRWIAGRAGGDTDTSRDHEYTSWTMVDEFLQDFLHPRADSPFLTAHRLYPREASPAETRGQAAG